MAFQDLRPSKIYFNNNHIVLLFDQPLTKQDYTGIAKVFADCASTFEEDDYEAQDLQDITKNLLSTSHHIVPQEQNGRTSQHYEQRVINWQDLYSSKTDYVVDIRRSPELPLNQVDLSLQAFTESMAAKLIR